MTPPRSRPLLLASLLPALLLIADRDVRTETPARIAGAEKVQVNLVLIDVVVRDRKDRPVSGLTRDDFELLVDRLPVDPADIESFEEVCRQTPEAGVPTAASPEPPAAPAPVTAGEATAASSPRHIVVYFDFSHLSLGGRRQALKSAREHMVSLVGPDDRVMILAYKKGLRLVQDFTSDAALLASRLDDMLADNTTLDSNVLEEGQNMYDVANKPCDVTGSTCTARRSLADTYATQEEMRARKSLHAIEGLMPALAGLKGRKALVIFTDVLRDEPGVQYVTLAHATAKSEGINLQPDLLHLTQEANAAGVSIYTVHASGLDDSAIEQFRDAKPDNVQLIARQTGGRIESAGSASETFDAARTGLDSALAIQTTMALETGGHAALRTNDVGAILDTAKQDLSCYYMLGYRYQAQSDNARHSLIVKLRPDRNGDPRRGLTVRHRPYYNDVSPAQRRERLMRSALDVPDLYHAFPVETEAFALAPESSGRRVLIKTTVPRSSLSLIPAGGSSLEGRVIVRGEVSVEGADGKPACAFEHEVPVTIDRRKPEPASLIVETGCLLPPDRYQLALAVLDPTSQEVGARRTALLVQAADAATHAYVSDVGMWTREPAALVVSVGSEVIGLKSGSGGRAFVPRSERRLAKGQEAMMSFLLCPAAGSPATPGNPIRVKRTLLGEGDAAVASFRDLVIAEPPDQETGCYQIFNNIPANTLGDGVYRFTIQLMGAPLGAPVTREAALAVD